MSPLGKPGPGGKGSIFSGLSGTPAPAPGPVAAPRPAPAPAPAPKPAPEPRPAPKPAADPEAITALNRKMDDLERNIISQLERRLGDQMRYSAPPPPVYYAPPPPPPGRAQETDLLLKKIEEMERRLSDFSHAAVVSASQLKNIEESKISARREIEDLLKAVREQQKYSELDRQMHEQLERAWSRAEELEKKLMEFYSSVLALETRRREDADRASDKTASALDLLAQRLESLEKRIVESSPAGELRAAQEEFFRRAQEEALRQAAAQQAFRAEIAAGIEKMVVNTPAGELRAAQDEFFVKAREEERRHAAALEASRQEMAAGVKESAQAFKEIFENYVRVEMELLRNKIYSETETLRRETAAAAEESRKLLREQSALAAEKNARFEDIARENVLKTEGIDASIAAAARRQADALEEFSRRLRSEIGAMNQDFSAAAKAENDKRFEKFGAKYAEALLSAAFVESFRAAVAESVDKFEKSGAQLEAFLKEASPDQLQKATGVSGMMIRRQFETMTAMLEALRTDTTRLREIKKSVEDRFGDIFKEG